MTAERIAVLLMAYGGPSSLDEVEPYLLDVRGGRPTAPELLLEIRERYRRIGAAQGHVFGAGSAPNFNIAMPDAPRPAQLLVRGLGDVREVNPAVGHMPRALCGSTGGR